MNLRMMSMLAVLLLVLLVACGPISKAKEIHTGTEPDLEATVEARVNSTIAALPAAQTNYWPTFADFSAVAQIPAGTTPIMRRIVEVRFSSYAHVYVANSCISGTTLTATGFRNFMLQNQDIDSVRALAGELIGRMTSYTGEDVEVTCVQTYLYPQSATQLVLAIGLAETEVLSRINPFLARNLYGIVEEHAYRWYGSGGSERIPLVLDLCCELINGRWHFDANTPVYTARPTGTPLVGRFEPPESWVLMLENRRTKDDERLR